MQSFQPALGTRILPSMSHTTMRMGDWLWRLRERRRDLGVLTAMCALYFFSYFQRMAVPGTIFDELQQTFAAPAGAIAALSAIFLYVYGPMQLVTGLLADRFGGLRVLTVGGGFLAVGSLLFPLAPSLHALYLTRAVIGLGASLMFIGIIKEIDTRFRTRDFAMLLSGALLIGYSGGLAGMAPLERAVAQVGWRSSLLMVGAACGLTLMVTLLALRPFRSGAAGPPPSARLSFMMAARNRPAWPVIVTGAINFSVYFLMQAVLGKKMLSDCGGLTSAQAASLVTLMMLVNMTGMTASGFLSRAMRNRRKPILLACTGLTLATTAAMTLLLWRHASGAWLGGGLLALAMAASASPIFTSATKELSPAPLAGTAVGLGNGVCYLLMAVTANLAGWVLDGFAAQAERTAAALVYPPAAYATIFLGCLLMATFSFALTFTIRESGKL